MCTIVPVETPLLSTAFLSLGEFCSFCPQSKIKERGLSAMDSSSKIQTLTSTPGLSKRLLLDRRYGLVFDEWRDPSEAALDGGRQMFCIVPLAKGLFKMASELANLTANSTIKVLQTPDLLSPPMLQATLNDHLHKFMSGIQKQQPKPFALKGFSPFHQTSGSSHLPTERSESQ